MYPAAMHGLLYRLRGIQAWPETQAFVTRVDELSQGGRGGAWNRIVFTYKPADEPQSGELRVDSYSSLFNLSPGETFPIQYDPQHADRFYVEEAQSLFGTLQYVMLGVVLLFIMAVILVNFFG